MITFDETLDRLKKISVSRGEDYSYSYDPKALQKTHLEHANDDQYETTLDKDGKEYTTSCYYKFLDGTPGCIAGVFMDEVAPGYELREHENITANLNYPVSGERLEFEETAKALLREAQRLQDLGQKWPEAVQHAEAYVREAYELD
jgi:hypothetical protein